LKNCTFTTTTTTTNSSDNDDNDLLQPLEESTTVAIERQNTQAERAELISALQLVHTIPEKQG
jgi:hypothetical protein